MQTLWRLLFSRTLFTHLSEPDLAFVIKGRVCTPGWGFVFGSM